MNGSKNKKTACQILQVTQWSGTSKGVVKKPFPG
jgi:hypothetical protein